MAKAEQKVTVAEMIAGSLNMMRYLLHKWVLFGIVMVCFGLLGILYAWMKKPAYIAEMRFTTEAESGPRLGGYAGLAAQFGFDLGMGSSNIFEGENLIALLQSSNLIEKTLLTTSGNGTKLMIDEYADFTGMRKGWAEDQKLSSLHFTSRTETNSRVQDSVLKSITANIITGSLRVFKKNEQVNIITAQVISGDEFFSKRFSELLMENAIQFYTDYKSRKAQQNVAILQRQTDSVRGILFGSISDIAAINDLNVNPLRQSGRTSAQRRQIDVQVSSALYTELLKNLELAKLTLRKETPLIQVIDRPKLPLEKKKPGRLKTGIVFALVGAVLLAATLLFRKYLQDQVLLKKDPVNPHRPLVLSTTEVNQEII